MNVISNANPMLMKSQTTGGWNTASGSNRKYLPSRPCWSVFYTDSTGHRAELCFRRKVDARAVFGWMIESEWNGAGDFEDLFILWARDTQNAIAKTYKGLW
jgi:hypothetical protein